MTSAQLAQALRMSLSALLAFSLATQLDIQNAYWAAMPVWVVAQSSRGLLIERGIYRLLGTLAGAAAGFALLAATRNPLTLLAALALWVAAMATATHLLPGVKSYAATLAGMTAAVVLLPCLHAGEQLLPLAIARVQCTLIGVLTVTLVTGWFTPAAGRREFYLRIRKMAADATDFAAQAVSGHDDPQQPAHEQRLLLEIADAESAARTMAAGSLQGWRRLRHTTALAAASLALMSAASALRARRLRGDAVDETLPRRLLAQAQELRTDGKRTVGATAWPAHGAEGPETRLHEAMRQIVQAEEALFADRPVAVTAAMRLPPQRDWQRARIRGPLAGLATFVAALAGLWSGWAAGELMALGVCIFSMVLGSLPSPRLVAPRLLAGVIVGVAAAMLYRFFIQPQVAGPLGLIASVAPFIVLGALARAYPRTALPALDANMCFMLGSQAGMPEAGPAEILGGSLALALAALLVVGALLLSPERRDARLHALLAGLRRDIGRRQAAVARAALQLLGEYQRLGRSASLPAGLLSALGFSASLGQLREFGEPTAAGVRVLEGFGQDPAGTADEAVRLAHQAPNPVIGLEYCDAADALRSGSAWLAAAPA
ncbi:hypothetical protein GT347_12090 [Xylophilus rhododendri]|uniref:FUSC family protein n=1 Tax=Xylophilus rhododendri TaxID=2697032 RepID=A0A857J7B8_9BURK|nr:FUSC family protein [Xylophilus rhododendri]QHI98668.1 hypothetical protein GT347_12090 [Xylophilus rhododendri]